MKRCIEIALASGFLLSACAPLELYYKEGETVAQMERDELQCQTASLRQVPTDIRQRYIPPTYQSYKVCNALGHCHWHRRLLSPGRFESYDANVGLRTRVTQQCMADRGYIPTKIKRCDTSTKRETSPEITRVLPPVSDATCAIRLKSGRWQIVSPAT